MINSQDNRISPVTVKTFSDLDFKEREHLQEWQANQPSALGDELLITQKKFKAPLQNSGSKLKTQGL
ncbi:hypothetical protein [Candidatus Vondammii sp. HM_W22]|uniref:hypothetical protein n=1 Tax=Candidatus Vondammii sp. HM_W22 TaxID=2687299 RepID=UPI001F1317FD|nr:hypothetical protein [Candidatus Vondammii sp. HM_W22]